MRETVIANGEASEIEVKPITLLCHPGNVNLEVPGRVEIIAPGTVERADAISADEWAALRIAPGFVDLFKTVFPDMDVPENLRGEGHGVRHIIGMMVMFAEAQVAGKQAFFRMPETYLHPRYQANLGDLFLKLSGVKP